MMAVEERSNWIRPKELVNLVEANGDRTDNLERRLLPFLKAGSLRSRIESVVLNETRIEIEDHLLPAAIWAKIYDHAYWLQVDAIRFNSGGYKPTTEFEGAGLSFDRSKVMELLDLREIGQGASAQDRQNQQRGKKSNGGRRPNKENWEDFAAALATVAHCSVKGLASGRPAAEIYEEVAIVLQKHLGPNATPFEIDNVRDAITLAQAWIADGMPTD